VRSISRFCMTLVLVGCGSGGGGSSGEDTDSGETEVVTPWARSYGGTGTEEAGAVCPTGDDGMIVVGWTTSFGHGSEDLWAVKLSAEGAVEWQKAYGGASTDRAYGVCTTNDGGYAVVGSTNSFAAGISDVWVLKLESTGEIQNQKSYGTSTSEIGWAIQQTTDGGYVVAGQIGVNNDDAWILKLNADLSLDWERAYGGAGLDQAKSIQQTSDGGYVFAGVVEEGAGPYNIWVVKLSNSGAVTWQYAYGNGSASDLADSIHQTTDGGYIVAGRTSAGAWDAWLLKLSGAGALEWQKQIGVASSPDYAYSVRQLDSGGILFAGSTGTATDGQGWVVSLTSTGAISWQRAYGGISNDAALSLRTASDGSIAIAGRTESYGSGGKDFWVLRLASDGTVPPLGIDSAAGSSTTSATVTDTSTLGSGAAQSPTVATSTSTATSTGCAVAQQAP